MPVIREGYYEIYNELREAYPGKYDLSMRQVCLLLKKDQRTLLRDKTFPVKRAVVGGLYTIKIASLARWLSQ